MRCRSASSAAFSAAILAASRSSSSRRSLSASSIAWRFRYSRRCRSASSSACMHAFSRAASSRAALSASSSAWRLRSSMRCRSASSAAFSAAILAASRSSSSRRSLSASSIAWRSRYSRRCRSASSSACMQAFSTAASRSLPQSSSWTSGFGSGWMRSRISFPPTCGAEACSTSGCSSLKASCKALGCIPVLRFDAGSSLHRPESTGAASSVISPSAASDPGAMEPSVGVALTSSSSSMAGVSLLPARGVKPANSTTISSPPCLPSGTLISNSLPCTIMVNES